MTAMWLLFQYTQPKRAATVALVLSGDLDKIISIHAAQEGCDKTPVFNLVKTTTFQSTQPKRAATVSTIKESTFPLFQSTQPKRAATGRNYFIRCNCTDFNPRSPRGLRLPSCFAYACFTLVFQSTQPKRAATSVSFFLSPAAPIFQSTQPKRAATCCAACCPLIPRHFNPRSPRGLRQNCMFAYAVSYYFNPRSPRGLRQYFSLSRTDAPIFQSTQPKRAATTLLAILAVALSFQSTQPKRAATNASS